MDSTIYFDLFFKLNLLIRSLVFIGDFPSYQFAEKSILGFPTNLIGFDALITNMCIFFDKTQNLDFFLI